MIYNIIISPLETIFDWIFNFAQNGFPQFGVIGAIFAVSLGMNILALPLYNIADRIQENERRQVKSMEKWVRHIRRTFTGDERFMMLSEYYRQNRYHPIFALKSTLSILIQIPFFIAAYHYLRGCEALQEASFWIFKDLSAPDALIPLKFGAFSFSVNLLPILMTAINCISGAIYAKDSTFREKAQIYLLAAVFLVLLYNSPSGLVIYWILNNIFSLVKNAVKKNKRKPLLAYLALAAAIVIRAHVKAGAMPSGGKTLLKGYVFAAAIFAVWKALAYLCPKIAPFARNQFNPRLIRSFVGTRFPKFSKILSKFIGFLKGIWNEKPGKTGFFALFLSGLGLSVLCGLVLPSSVISSSPQEFSFLGNTPSPISYILRSALVFAGFFVFWPVAVYFLFGKKVRKILPALMFALLVCAVFNVYVFRPDWGNLDVSFNLADTAILDNVPSLFVLVPLEILVACVAVYAAFTVRKKIALVNFALFAVCLGMAGIGCANVGKIRESYEEYAANLEKYGSRGFMEGGIEPVYHLSKTGKNVVVLFLDRGIGPFVGEIFENYPEIKEKFEGFTWYPNTVSFSQCTVTGAPPLYGGYEYAPEAMNDRKDEFLRDKNNEAQLLLPKLFIDAGFSATVTDPTWPNFKWSGDLSAYEKLPGVVAKELEGTLYNNYITEKGLLDYNHPDEICFKQIANFSFLQILHPTFRHSFYEKARVIPKRKGISDGARGWLWRFSHLYYLPKLTDFDCTGESGAFISLHSLAAHDVFTPLDDLETPADENLKDWDGMTHFLCDAAAFKQFGKFFDYLRENDCYDNTRIIIVSDHAWWGGENNHWFDNFKSPKPNEAIYLNSMLLMKDFDSKGDIKIEDSFMTQADTLFLAKAGLNLSDINPFTGKKLEQMKDNGVNTIWVADWNAANFYDETQFPLSDLAWHVSGDIYDEKNWVPLAEWKERGGAK